MSKRSRTFFNALQMTLELIRLINDHLSPSEVAQAMGRLLSGENGLMRHFLVLSTSSDLEPENGCLKQAEWEIKALSSSAQIRPLLKKSTHMVFHLARDTIIAHITSSFVSVSAA